MDQNKTIDNLPPSVPAQAPSYSNSNTSKRSLVTILTCLLVLVLALIGYLYLSKKTATPIQTTLNPVPAVSPTQTPFTNDLSEWKTYTDEKNRFEFKYPPSYSLTSWGDSDTPLLNHKIFFRVSERGTGECEGKGDCGSGIFAKKDMVINEHNVHREDGELYTVFGNFPQSFVEYYIKYPNEDKYFNLTLYELSWTTSSHSYDRKAKPIPKDEIGTVEKILSTFRFTNQINL